MTESGGEMLLQPDQVVGQYIVQRFAGEGGMGEVYRVTHRILGSVHAMKVLRPEWAAIEDTRIRFLNEGKIQARLRHPHIVPVTDLIHEPGIAGLIMDWIDGSDIDEYVEKNGPFSPARAVELAQQALKALAYIHKNKVIHRDIKPSNIFLDSASGQIKLMDFGIARQEGSGRTTRILLGTPEFMSPEQTRSAKNVDARSDLFSLGCVLYYMLSAKNPFHGESMIDISIKIIKGDFTPLTEAMPSPQEHV